MKTHKKKPDVTPNCWLQSKISTLLGVTENCFLFQICTLDPVTVINRLLISVLPLELAQDVYTYSGSDHERAKMAGALLTGYFLPLFSIDFLES